MRSHLKIIALVSLGIALAACGPAPQVTETEAIVEADLDAIDSLRDEFLTAHNANEASRLAALYTDGAVLMPPNEESVTGKQGVESWYQANFDQFTAELTLSSEEVEVAGDWAFDRGTYTITLTPKDDGEPIEDNGKYIVILQKQPDNSWKITHAIWNSNIPIPAPEAESD
ncbi:SgcJ/EcaC family oxidoreductase [Acidobacteria bacterium AH-259-G07]|nr:SgcJ/EcaC family oxidoreductase [Acidobacteria bacterium AH-259-G07]